MKRALMAAAAAAGLWSVPAPGGAAEYKLSGTYFETSACNVGCPCIYMENATGRTAEFTAAWNIEKGAYNGIDIAGRTLVAVISAPGGNRAKSVGKWKGMLYVDWDTTPKQKKALEGFFNERFGQMFSAPLAARQVPVRFEARQRGGIYGVYIPGVLSARIRRVNGVDNNDILVQNAPLAFTSELHLAVSEENRYEDKEGLTGLGLKTWNAPQGRNGYFGPFDYAQAKGAGRR